MPDDNALQPHELLYAAMRSLPGWYGHLEDAADREFGGRSAGARAVGGIISSVLIAAGEENVPLAVNGKIDETGAGNLYVVYSDFIVTVWASHLRDNNPTYETKLLFLSDATDLRVQTKHSYFDGTDTYPRNRGIALSFVIAGERIELSASHWTISGSHLVQDDAMYTAFAAIRSKLAAR